MSRAAFPGCVALALLGHAALAWFCLQGGVAAHATPVARTLQVVLSAPPAAPVDPETVVAAQAAPAVTSETLAPARIAPAELSDLLLESPVAPPPRDAARRQATSEQTAGDDARPRDLAVTSEPAFVPPSELERPALPRSAPDLKMIEGLAWSGVPMRLRLYVDAAGKVVDVHVLQSSDPDDVMERVRRMFLATGFIPGRAHGIDVASYKDIELQVGEPG